MGVCVPAPPPGQIRFCNEVTPVFLLEETGRHALSATENISVSLGVSASIYPLLTNNAWGILPVGSVVYANRFSPPPRDVRNQVEASNLRISAELAPTINIFTGSPSNRLQLTATLVEHMTANLSFNFVAGALQTVPLPHADPSPLTLLSGGVEARVRLTRFISASAGLQAFWQAQQNVGALPSANTSAAQISGSEVGYMAVTVRPPTLRF